MKKDVIISKCDLKSKSKETHYLSKDVTEVLLMKKELSPWVKPLFFSIFAVSFLFLGRATVQSQNEINQAQLEIQKMKKEIITILDQKVDENKLYQSNQRLVNRTQRSMKDFIALEFQKREDELKSKIDELKHSKAAPQRTIASIKENKKPQGQPIAYSELNYKVLRYQFTLERNEFRKKIKLEEDKFVNNNPNDIDGFLNLQKSNKIKLYKLTKKQELKLSNFRRDRYTYVDSPESYN